MCLNGLCIVFFWGGFFAVERGRGRGGGLFVGFSVSSLLVPCLRYSSSFVPQRPLLFPPFHPHAPVIGVIRVIKIQHYERNRCECAIRRGRVEWAVGFG